MTSAWTHRQTLLALARHDVRRAYAGTTAGRSWLLLGPLVPFVVLTLVFSFGLRLPLGGGPYVLGFAAAYTPWVLLSGAVAGSASSMIDHRHIVKRVPFPLHLIPFVRPLTHLVPHLLLVTVTALACFASGYGGVALLTLPYFLVCAVVLALGLGIGLSALAVVLRDVNSALPSALQVWFWITPVAWAGSQLPAAGERLLDLNPAAYVVTGYRHAFMPQAFAGPTLGQALAFWLITGATLAVATYVFRRLRPHFWECL